MKDPHVRVARWAIKLQQYNLKFSYFTGKSNVVADTLSRFMIASSEDTKNEEEIILNINIEENLSVPSEEEQPGLLSNNLNTNILTETSDID